MKKEKKKTVQNQLGEERVGYIFHAECSSRNVRTGADARSLESGTGAVKGGYGVGLLPLLDPATFLVQPWT